MNKRRGKIPEYLRHGYEPEYSKLGIEPEQYANQPQKVAGKQNKLPPNLGPTFRNNGPVQIKVPAGQYDPKEKRSVVNIPNVGNVDKSWSSNRLRVENDEIDLDAVQVGDTVQEVYNDEAYGDYYDDYGDHNDHEEARSRDRDPLQFRKIGPVEHREEYIIYHADNKYEASSKDEVLQLLDAMLLRDINIEENVLVYKKVNVKFGINLE